MSRISASCCSMTSMQELVAFRVPWSSAEARWPLSTVSNLLALTMRSLSSCRDCSSRAARWAAVSLAVPPPVCILADCLVLAMIPVKK